VQRRTVHERLSAAAPCVPQHTDEDALAVLDDSDPVAQVTWTSGAEPQLPQHIALEDAVCDHPAMRRRSRLVVGLFLILVATPVLAEAPQWVLYTHPDKLMSVRFPSTPTEQDQETDSPIGRLKVKMARFETKDRAFLATALVYPIQADTPFDTKAALDGARDQMLAKMKGEVTAEKPVKLDGFSGREFHFEAPGPSGKIRGSARLYASAKPPSVYMAIVMRRTDKPDPDASKFLDSMHLGKKVESKR